MYTEKTIDHFTNPRNMGEIKDAEFFAEGGNPACGDVVKLWLNLDPAKKKITDIKFKAFGCGACIASSSALTEMVKGQTIEKALKISREDISKYLDGLPERKNNCSNFSLEVLKKALDGLSKT